MDCFYNIGIIHLFTKTVTKMLMIYALIYVGYTFDVTFHQLKLIAYLYGLYKLQRK